MRMLSAFLIGPVTSLSAAFPTRIVSNNRYCSGIWAARRLGFWFSCRMQESEVGRLGHLNSACSASFSRAQKKGAVVTCEQEAFVENTDGGLEATLNSSSKWILTALFCSIVLWRRDAESLWAFVGAFLNSVVSTWLKTVLNQERPNSALRPEPGMPSTHAQSFFFIVTFLNLSMMESYGANELTVTLGGFFLLVAAYFSWLRVTQQLHTVSQVAVGAVLGSIMSILWLWSWNAYVANSALVSSPWTSRVVAPSAVLGGAVGVLVHAWWSWMTEDQD